MLRTGPHPEYAHRGRHAPYLNAFRDPLVHVPALHGEVLSGKGNQTSTSGADKQQLLTKFQQTLPSGIIDTMSCMLRRGLQVALSVSLSSLGLYRP